MRHDNKRRVLPPALLIVLAAGGCGDPAGDARETAVGEARQTAANAEAAFTTELRQAAEAGDDDDALRERIRSALETRIGGFGRPLEVTVGSGRQVVAQAVFFGHGEAGGGWTAESYNVRLCAELRGVAGTDPAVQVENLDCPGDLQSGTSMVGTVDETVPLRD